MLISESGYTEHAPNAADAILQDKRHINYLSWFTLFSGHFIADLEVQGSIGLVHELVQLLHAANHLQDMTG